MNQSPIRWGVERRLEFIEFRLFWEAGLNRADIINAFDISVPQASNDLSRYQELAPQNIRYDKKAKRYFATDLFEPIFLKPDADQYLSRLTYATDPYSSSKGNWLSTNTLADVLPAPHRHVDVTILQKLLEIIRERNSVDVFYQSMNSHRPQPIWRRITPHAFVNDGVRWHVRAFCHIRDQFRDFLLSRFLDVGEQAESATRPEDDIDWTTFFDIKLTPNPQLSAEQQKVIAHDYDMVDGLIEVSVRKALLYYFKRRLRLDVALLSNEPREAPVVIQNIEEFEKAISQAN